ncbi:hypothetical protein SAMN04515647_3718 [Cohaesibacter sp. ES.047]|uniref:GPW/gp25 family protein n=1 Tax=Cohaesibacter sp. ES.047 TaxID=1798205 RepID=UPI000BBFD898|nr:GPW/gp25 family protein [Cohaesibacter sp. ES.047]SNY93423.1 hypothetical protein SAMN04515647_3718 [Cohaesibacter sp. ES.047]
MAGTNGRTGKPLVGIEHVVQSIEIILQTKFGELVQLEEFGSFVTSLLLRENQDNRTAALIYWIIALAIDLWEPRFRLTRFIPDETVDKRRDGVFSFGILGSFMPRAHLGDFTVAKANVTIRV